MSGKDHQGLGGVTHPPDAKHCIETVNFLPQEIGSNILNFSLQGRAWGYRKRMTGV